MSDIRMTPRRMQILRKLSGFDMSPRQIEGSSTLPRGWSRRILREMADTGLVASVGSNSCRETVWRITDRGTSAIEAARAEVKS